MFGFLKKKDVAEVDLKSICNGRVIPIEEVPDKMFAQKMLGDGVGFELSENGIYSPCAGEVIMVAATKHAIGIRADNGAEILIHIGLDTVNLNGKGLDVSLRLGQRVRCGQNILNVDLDYMKENNVNMVSAMILTNGIDHKLDIIRNEGQVYTQDILMHISKR